MAKVTVKYTDTRLLGVVVSKPKEPSDLWGVRCVFLQDGRFRMRTFWGVNKQQALDGMQQDLETKQFFKAEEKD